MLLVYVRTKSYLVPDVDVAMLRWLWMTLDDLADFSEHVFDGLPDLMLFPKVDTLWQLDNEEILTDVIKLGERRH